MGYSALMKKASLVGAFFVFGFSAFSVQAFCPAPGPLPPVKVARVVDGDTLRLVDGRSVRLIGVNAPERARNGRPAEAFAESAYKRLHALVNASNGQIGLRLGQPTRDHYGRTLAHTYDAKGQNLEAQLLAEGLAYQVAFAPDSGLVDCQREAESQARQAGLGVWKRSPVLAPSAIRASGFTLLQGRVTHVERNAGGLWLDLQDGVVLRIEPKRLRYFVIEDLQVLVGRRIEVRGWLIDRARRGGLKPGQARWLLPLTHPAMIEVVR